ncbi:hypothetical protein BGX38DRAFT_1275602 [Terfezia claveryi]|nr:hypothetical protein BGX38DRAFT_1275602 [Terfezia claveryi]
MAGKKMKLMGGRAEDGHGGGGSFNPFFRGNSESFKMRKRDRRMTICRIGILGISEKILKAKSSDLEILVDEEEVNGSDDGQGDYITEEEAVQYATITLGEQIV